MSTPFDIASGRPHTFGLRGKPAFLTDRTVEELHHEFMLAQEQRTVEARKAAVTASRLAKERKRTSP